MRYAMCQVLKLDQQKLLVMSSSFSNANVHPQVSKQVLRASMFNYFSKADSSLQLIVCEFLEVEIPHKRC